MDAEQYVGLPFKWSGFDRDGISCWGLVRLVVMEQLGKENVPTYEDVSEKARAGNVDIASYFDGGYPIDLEEATVGDILHMYAMYGSRRLPYHIGIIVAPGKVLHILQGQTSVIEDYRRQPLKNDIIGAYRVA